ncbi:MAG: BatD family protein [Gammaproteobacteria bacterium]|nr:BatD family protein [Gammaproteobacteria bacterium]
MKKTLATFAFSVLALCLSLQELAAQTIEASVDRDQIARGETLVYTIRIYEQRQGMQLDLTPLTDDFDVLGTRTSSQVRSINGAVESWTDYIITLFPLNEGEIEIPAIEISDTQTTPIIVTVSNEGPRSNQDSDELFLEIEVNKETVYVQEQLLFTIKLYYTINGIRNPQFTELEMDDTVIQLIGSPNQYENLIEGVRYGVYEKRYVIFPQRSGPLQIPDILFRGEVTDGSSNFVFRNLNTRRVTAFIDGITIDVEERPPAALTNDNWLPVTNLSLEEEWNTDINNLRVGDSIERTITMIADGLDGAVLPPFSPEDISGLNIYSEPADIERNYVDGSIVGTRTETSTLVATESGQIEIPEIQVPWWNVETDTLETAVIPATLIEVASITGVVPSEQAITPTDSIEDLLAASPTLDRDMIDAQEEAEFIEVNASWLNYSILFAFFVVAISVYRLVIFPNQGRINQQLKIQKTAFKARYAPENNEKVAFNRLKTACKTRNLRDIREALIVWSGHYTSSRAILTMEDILQEPALLSLHPSTTKIQALLFNESGKGDEEDQFIPGDFLKTASHLRGIKSRQDKFLRTEQRFALPPLYKTT